MGIYWNNFIYYGAIISTEQYKILTEKSQYKENMNVYKSYFKTCGKHYILYIPQTYVNFNNINPMFEEHEIQQGFIPIDDVKSCLRRRLTEDQMKQMLNPPTNQKHILEEIINLLGDPTIGAHWEMSQCVSTSLIFPNDDSQLEQTLKIKFPKLFSHKLKKMSPH